MLRRTPALAATPVALAAALLAAPARADEPPGPQGFRLAWVRAAGAESCPSVATLAGEVVARLGRDPFTGPPGRFIEGQATREQDAWVAQLNVRDEAGALLGARALRSEAATCVSLAAAVALAVALVIDPRAALAPPPAPRPVVRPPPAPAPRPVAPRPVAPRRPPPPPWDTTSRASVRALAALGLLPGIAAPGVALALEGYLFQRLRGAVGVLFFPEARTAGADPSFGFGLTAGSLGLCLDALYQPRWSLAGCAGVMGGALHAVVYSPVPTAPGARAWLAGAAGLRLSIRPIGPLALEVGADAVVPVLRYGFAVEGRNPIVFEQTYVTGVGYLGLGLTFP